MPNTKLEQFRDMFGDDLYVNDPILKWLDTDPSVNETIKTSQEIQQPTSTQTVKAAPIEHEPLSPNQQPLKQVDEYDLTQINSLQHLHETIQNCEKCGLCKSRNSFVFGKGSHDSDIMIIGEAPGAEEDKQGLPFVGRAGQLLDKILAAVDLNLSNVFISNIIKCRPPNNRDPEPIEIQSCREFLDKQIDILKPKIILSLGRVSGRTLLNQELSLSKMRGKVHQYRNIPLVVTYHPSALLRNEAWKRPTWEDMKMFKQTYESLKGNS